MDDNLHQIFGQTSPLIAFSNLMMVLQRSLHSEKMFPGEQFTETGSLQLLNSTSPGQGNVSPLDSAIGVSLLSCCILLTVPIKLIFAPGYSLELQRR